MSVRRAIDRQDADAAAAQMGIGLVLFWPALFFLEGGDGAVAAEYARLKGEAVALEQASRQKRCGLNGIEGAIPTC